MSQLSSWQVTATSTLVLVVACGQNRSGQKSPASTGFQHPELFTKASTGPDTGDQPSGVGAQLDKLKLQPQTATVERVNLSATALREAGVHVTLPNGRQLDLVRTSSEQRGAGDFTWFGSAAAAEQATLVVNGDEVTGMIRQGNDLYRVEPLAGKNHALIQLNPARFPPDHPPSFAKTEADALKTVPQITPFAARADGPVGIDVLVGYTPAVRAAVSDIGSTVRLALDEANQSYRNSNVSIRLSLVDSMPFDYSETGRSFETILADFAADANVAARRRSAGADISVLLIDKGDYCGLAQAIMADRSTAFAVVYHSCATGYYSFAHEIGHLQGARHDPGNDPSTTPFPYGHGLQHGSTVSSSNWRTIMAYDCSPSCPRIQYWANPSISFGGFAMGSAALNNDARVLNETAFTVANFMERRVNPGAVAQ